jgi:ribulose-5-phosphate 4-epimerase/fuculose-1-phosphate aldolase
MGALETAIDELVAANRILANQDVVDAYGHVSVRHPLDPTHFLLSRSRSPELVDHADIVEYGPDGEAVDAAAPPPYLERFIHAGIYEARPDVNAVIHSHAEDVIAFTITGQPLKPVFHSGAGMGKSAPVWDIREKFGDRTNLLVSKLEHGRDLARRLGNGRIVLMRGHGFAAAGASVYEALRIAVFLPRNAAILTTALRFGEVTPLSEGEIDTLNAMDPKAPASRRAWEYWCAKAGFTPAG